MHVKNVSDKSANHDTNKCKKMITRLIGVDSGVGEPGHVPQ